MEVPIHPHAVALARSAGMSRNELGNLITEYAMNLDDFLVGGYLIDAAIIGCHIALSADAHELDMGLTHSDVIERVVDAILKLYNP